MTSRNDSLESDPCTFTRRRFVRMAGLAAAGSLLAPAVLRSANPDSKKRVLIIGGGVSGLAAAHKLRAAGFHPVLIEGRERLGGRIWTDKNGFDLGASWIHGKTGNPLMELVKATNSKTFAFDYDNHWRYGVDGELSDKADRLIDRNFAALEREIAKNQRRAGVSLPLQSIVDEFSGRIASDERPGLRYAVRTNITHEYAADPARLSLRYFDGGAEQRGGDLLLPGGYSRLLAALEPAGETHLGHTVEQIDWRQDEVAVLTNKGTFSGASAIITLPLGVLKSRRVRFTPALPDRHRQAIERLGFGTLDKIILRFPKVAWPVKPHLFGFVGEGLWEEWVNLVPVTGQPALMGFNAGDLAEQMERKGDRELTESAMRVLRKMFGAALPSPASAIVTRWRQDPFALGSYSSYAPGSSPKDREALASPIAKNVLLAGEACSLQHPATVHGALQSGRAAAALIIQTCGITS